MSLRLENPDHPALWSRARELTPEDIANHQQTIALMTEAMTRVGAAGIAAPQIGLGLRMFVTKYEAFPVCINPRWTQIGADFISKAERCLSRLDYSTYVRRSARIFADWQDLAGKPQSTQLESMEARVFMHLTDLCDGQPIFPRPLRHDGVEAAPK